MANRIVRRPRGTRMLQGVPTEVLSMCPNGCSSFVVRGSPIGKHPRAARQGAGGGRRQLRVGMG